MKYDCIIVLSNEMDKFGNLNLESKARIELACNAYFNGLSSTLITCGWNYRKDSKLFIGEALKNYAIKLGVPSEKILTELNPKDTVGEAFFTKINIIEKHNWRSLLIVTSDYHAYRAAKIFDFIYGTNYKMKIIETLGFGTIKKKLLEKKSLESFERTFENIKPGDTQGIYERMSIRHPYYNGDIHSKIILFCL